MPNVEQTPEEKLEEFRRKVAVKDLRNREGTFFPIAVGVCHVCRRKVDQMRPLRAQHTTMTLMACGPCADDLTSPEG